MFSGNSIQFMFSGPISFDTKSYQVQTLLVLLKQLAFPKMDGFVR